MLVAERHQKILELLEERKSIRVSELSRIFSITEETVRRDLEKLERQGKLMRSHGGALRIESSDRLEVPYDEREIMNVKEKKQIAKEAIQFVQKNDQIILDASTTAWYMAKELPNIPLTVLTNSIKVATELSRKSNISVISTGGFLRTESLSFVGPLAERSLESYYVNKAFLSCKGFHSRRGLSEANEQQAKVKEFMMKNAETVYMMVDSSKFGIQSFIKLGDFEQLDYVITDRKTKKEIIEQIEEKGIQVIQP